MSTTGSSRIVGRFSASRGQEVSVRQPSSSVRTEGAVVDLIGNGVIGPSESGIPCRLPFGDVIVSGSTNRRRVEGTVRLFDYSFFPFNIYKG